jgi:hypothetical protein
MKFNFVAKHAKRAGAGVHKAKNGNKAARNRQKQDWRKEVRYV